MIDLDEILQALSRERPIYHSESEADFQHAIAWRIHEALPAARVRLEYRPFAEERIYLDVLVASPEGASAIELKYLTRKLGVDADQEAFRLANHAAHPQRRYDFVHDVTRLERVVAALPKAQGAAILLTNDPSYWNNLDGLGCVDAAFRLHEGRRLAGRLDWASHTGLRTKEGREQALVLRGGYVLRWRDYSDLGCKGGRFRYLLVQAE